MKTVVAKFGGTSVATKESREYAIQHIRKLREAGYGVVAVVSAMGRRGAPYATDTLLGLVDGNCDQRTEDLLSSCGETISACVMSDQLCWAGIPAVPMNSLSADIRTDGMFGNANVRGMNTAKVKAILDKGYVPVITGFQGISEDGEIMTLGRGGSDTSAVEIGGFLCAEKVLIFTDVPGVAMADPRMVPQAKYLNCINSHDMIFLARWGAKVIHPRAVEAAERHHIRMWVLSNFDDRAGTEISENIGGSYGLLGIAALKHCVIGNESGVLWLSEYGVLPDVGGTDTVITALFRDISLELVREKYSEKGVFIQPIDSRTVAIHLIVPDGVASAQMQRIHSDWCDEHLDREPDSCCVNN